MALCPAQGAFQQLDPMSRLQAFQINEQWQDMFVPLKPLRLQSKRTQVGVCLPANLHRIDDGVVLREEQPVVEFDDHSLNPRR